MEKLKTYAIALTLAIVSVIGFSAYGLMDNQTEEVTTQQWHRVKKANGDFEWRTGAPSNPSCLTDPDICNVVLPTGLNPAEMSTEEIIENAVDDQYDFGYTTE